MIKKVESTTDKKTKHQNEGIGHLVSLYLDDFEIMHPNFYEVADLYDIVLREVEKALFAKVLKKTEGNQSVAAKILGINRNTLRKKLKDYNAL